MEKENTLKKKSGVHHFTEITVGFCLIVLWLIFDRAIPVFRFVAPTGADPGNWLSFAWEFGGEKIRMASGSYPPMVPLFLRALLYFLEPLLAVRIVGLTAYLLTAFAFFMMVRIFTKLPWLIQVSFGLLFAGVRSLGETYSFGGYPEILGFAFLIVSLFCSEMWLREGGRRWAFLSALFSAALVASHYLMATVYVFMMMVMIVFLIFLEMNQWRIFFKRAFQLCLGTSVLSFFSSSSLLHYLGQVQGKPTNPHGYVRTLHSMINAFNWMFGHSSRLLWGSMLLFSVILPFFVFRRRGIASLVALTWGSLIFFWGTLEIRSLHVLPLGIILSLALALSEIWQRKSFIVQKVVGVFSFFVIFLKVLTDSSAQFPQDLKWYEIITPPVLESLIWLKESTPQKSFIATTTIGIHNHPLGWWIEGFTKRPTLYQAPHGYLSFKEEQHLAAIAEQLFSEDVSEKIMTGILEDQKIDYLFIPRTHFKKNMEKLIKVKKITLVFQNSDVLIFQVHRRA